jgi:hypothetical protein
MPGRAGGAPLFEGIALGHCASWSLRRDSSASASRRPIVTQRLSGQHYYFEDGAIRPSPIELRYAWPAELDLMARLAGMRLEERRGGWAGEPFTGLSPAHVSIYRKP